MSISATAPESDMREDKPKQQVVQLEDATLNGDVVDAAKVDAAEHGETHVPADGRDHRLHPDHPINKLGKWHKFAILISLSWAGFVANYSAAAHLTAFVPMAKYFDVSIHQIANSVGYSLLGLAFGPILFWNPLSKTIGRRPTYLIGSVLFLPCIIWMALSKTYTSFAVARVFAGLASGFSQTVPPSTIADIYRKEVRGDKMAVFGVFVILAPAIAPFFGGLMVNSHPWQYIFWLTLAFAGLQLILFIFVVPETLWIEHDSDQDGKRGADLARQRIEEFGMESDGVATPVEDIYRPPKSGRTGAAWMPWHRPAEFGRILMSPILMARFIPITAPSFYYGSLFAWSVGITIVIPQIFEVAPYNFSSIAIGSSYLAFGIGSILGKSTGGIVGDKVMMYMQRRHGGRREPEYRLWALLPLLPLMFIGIFIVGITLQNKTHWIAPLIGGALFYVGLVTATGILQTYVLETYIEKSMDTQANFIFWKCMWGFAIPFFAHQWGVATSWLSSYAVQGALAAGMGAIICVGLIWKGYELRRAQGMPVSNWSLHQ